MNEESGSVPFAKSVANCVNGTTFRACAGLSCTSVKCTMVLCRSQRTASAVAPWLCVTAFRRLCSEQRARALRPDFHAHAVAPQLPEEPRLDAGRHFNHAVHLSLRHDFRIAVQGGEQLTVAEWNADPSDRTQCLRGRAEHAPQAVHPYRLGTAVGGWRDARRQHGVRVLLAYLSEEPRGLGQ